MCVHGPEVHYKIVLLMFLLNCEMLHTIIDRAYDYKTALQLECIPDNVALFLSSFAKAKGCTFTWTWTDVPHPRQEDGHSCGVHVLMVGLCPPPFFKGEIKCNFRILNFRGYFLMFAKFLHQKEFPIIIFTL